jgi:hypothetical protein
MMHGTSAHAVEIEGPVAAQQLMEQKLTASKDGVNPAHVPRDLNDIER